jgi:hypothetical protein
MGLVVEISSGCRDAIEDVARRTRRSPAFIARRALAAAPDAPPAAPAGPRVAFELATDEDDAKDTAAKIRAAAKTMGRTLGEAIEAAFTAARARFDAWAAREQAASAGERADDLDGGLRDAADPRATPARLAELAASEYPRVRALVAAHPAAGADALERLAGDRDALVRAALAARVAPLPQAAADARRRSTK